MSDVIALHPMHPLDTEPGTLEGLNMEDGTFLLAIDGPVHRQPFTAAQVAGLALSSGVPLSDLHGAYYSPQVLLDRAGAEKLHSLLGEFLAAPVATPVTEVAAT